VPPTDGSESFTLSLLISGANTYGVNLTASTLDGIIIDRLDGADIK